tara:strand:- start:543 stop:887 length:345 start_codon:yes stop_codon:yes gene_type:complete
MDSSLIDAINQYGFPIVAAMGLGYFVYYVWRWVTTEIKPVLGQASSTLVALIDRIRMLDNDMIRLTQKIQMVLELKEQYEKVTGKSFNLDIDEIEKVIDTDYQKPGRKKRNVQK